VNHGCDHARILVVDDEPDVCEVLRDALVRQGLTVESALTAADACAMAERSRPDLIVTDLRLGDGDGLEMLERLRRRVGDVPAVLMSGRADMASAGEACRRGCADFLTKPLDLPRLTETIRRALAQRQDVSRLTERNHRLRAYSRELNRRRHQVSRQLHTTGAALTNAYRTLAGQLTRLEDLLGFQRNLLACRSDDDVFRRVFGLYAERGPNLFGVALVCDEKAELQVIGRFGTPSPDSMSVARGIAYSLTDTTLAEPVVTRLDAATHAGIFPQWLHPHVQGASFMLVPLLPRDGQLIGLIVLYRKAGHSFTSDEAHLAELIGPAVALAVQGKEEAPDAPGHDADSDDDDADAAGDRS
jgi:DNA-binding response OmpR family regulator